jgi:uncharacterized protein YdaU (DUF1376 family)
MHYYKFNIKDWTRDTAHLSVEEEGVYRRLLDHYYESEIPIPSETQPVIRRLRLAGHEESLGIILEEFFFLESDGYHHKRCDMEISKYHQKAEVNRSNGKSGGRPRKEQENPTGFHVKPTNNLNHKPLTTNQEPEKNIGDQQADAEPKSARRNWLKELVDLGVDEKSAKDWMAVRKAKKASMTDSALEAVKREADIAGMTFGEAVKTAAENSWQGFKASWINKDQAKPSAMTKHTGFADRDYHAGLIEREDGTYGF